MSFFLYKEYKSTKKILAGGRGGSVARVRFSFSKELKSENKKKFEGVKVRDDWLVQVILF